MTKYSGFNMLTLGILYETVLRWVAPANRVLAYASKLIPKRLDPETGKPARVGTPDSVQVLTTQEDGSCGVYRLSGVVWHDPGLGVALYGSEGTLDLRPDPRRDPRRPARASPALAAAADPRRSCAAAGRSRPTSSPRSAASGRVTHTDFATGRPLHAVHRGRRPQLAPPGARQPAPEGVLEPEPLSARLGPRRPRRFLRKGQRVRESPTPPGSGPTTVRNDRTEVSPRRTCDHARGVLITEARSARGETCPGYGLVCHGTERFETEIQSQ